MTLNFSIGAIGGSIAQVADPSAVVATLTLFILESLLSFDNVAVLAVLVRPLDREARRKALLYGFVGGYVFRVLAVLLFLALLNNPILRALGGLYLLALAVRYYTKERALGQGARRRARAVFAAMRDWVWGVPPSPEESAGEGLPAAAAEEASKTGEGSWAVAIVRAIPAALALSAFWAAVLNVELTDLAFSIDEVVVAVAFTASIVIILLATLLSILALRLGAVYMARLIDWFPLLEAFVYLIVAFVGARLVLEAVWGAVIPANVSYVLPLALLLVPIAVKLAVDGWSGRGANGND